ncbi:MAG: thrombospondin type 3 repeat-containing protein, partial [Kiritimatiellia bacterium]|nr:thrombospondin type 3 repeat-containing protein [Kiritimatiellia bacterium]
VPEDQWVRLSVTVDYATSPLDDTFFRPRVNGSLCPSAQAFKAPDDLTAGGTWYMCANSPGRGGGGTKRISGVALEGRGLFDDLSVQTSTAFAHTGATETNGVPFTWFDQWGVARFPEVDNDGDGFDAAGEYAAGTDPTDAESLFRIIDCWSENGRFYLRFTGDDSGSPAPFAVERSTNALSSIWTTVDPSVPRAVAPETVNVWSEEMSPVLSPAFYRVKVLDN